MGWRWCQKSDRESGIDKIRNEGIIFSSILKYRMWIALEGGDMDSALLVESRPYRSRI